MSRIFGLCDHMVVRCTDCKERYERIEREMTEANERADSNYVSCERIKDKYEATFKEVKRLRAALALILPMAKGYAYANPVGRNNEFIQDAEQALGGPPHD